MAKKKAVVVEEQLELENMPESSPIGKACKKILAIKDEIVNANEALQTKLKDAKTKLIEMMKDEGKKKIVVDGQIFTMRHKEAFDDIAIKPKKKSKKQNSEEEDSE